MYYIVTFKHLLLGALECLAAVQRYAPPFSWLRCFSIDLGLY